MSLFDMPIEPARLQRNSDDFTAVRLIAESGNDHPVPMPNLNRYKLVGTYHPKAIPVILTTREEIDLWMTVLIKEALRLQRPLADEALIVVSREDEKHSENFAA